MMPPSWSSVFALFGLLTLNIFDKSLYVAVHLVLSNKQLKIVQLWWDSQNELACYSLNIYISYIIQQII